MHEISKRLERHLKGAANHWRIEILLLLQKEEEMNLEEISSFLHSNIKTLCEHTRKLHQAGLINKKHRGREVVHTLSPYGKKFVRFILSL